MKTYILADNQDITREGIKSILREIGSSKRIIEVQNFRELQNALSTSPNAVVLVDYTLFDFSSLEQMLIIKENAKNSSWLFFSEELRENFIRNAIYLDPTISFVLKHCSKEEIRTALQNLANNLNYICEPILELLKRDKREQKEEEKLTKSEKIILQEIAKGKTTKEIAKEKFLSFHTVNAHRRNIFRKLEVNNIQEAIKYAYRAGIVNVSDYQI